MAQVQQANVTPLSNGGAVVVTSENGATVNGIDVEIQNGNTTPTKDAYGASSSSTHDVLDDQVQLSPASLRRRSTRASALKAQEKIKLKDDVVQSVAAATTNSDDANDDEMDDGEAAGLTEDEAEVPQKKQKLDDGKDLDQFCFRFGLRANDEGDVYAMTDESENSSIHSSEMAVIHAHHEKMLSREMTAEQLNERTMMRKEAESQLRIEEAKLALLKRMKQSQTCAIQKLAEAKRMTANLPNLNSNAYKPIFAPPLNKSSTSNGKPSSQPPTKNAALLALAGMTPQQQQELLARLAQNSSAAQQALLQSKKSGNSAQIQQMLTQLILNAQQQINKDKDKTTPHVNGNSAAAAAASSSSSSSLAAAQNAAANSLSQAQAKLMASQTPQQRSLAARMAFRAQADKQLMLVASPKAPPPDMFFIPNPSQPAFTYLLGLDLVVSRVLKDKTLEKKYTDEPYECEECHTDFTPSWKAIGSPPDKMHLYCEQCIKNAQKKKIRADHTTFLKKAYQKISTQEKEFEKKIAEGTLEQVFEQSRPSAATPNAATVASTSSSSQPAVNRLHASGSGTSTPKSATPATSSTPKLASGASSSSSSKKAPNAQQLQNAFLQQLMNNPMAAGMMRNNGMMQQMMKMSAYMSAAAQQQAARGVNMPNMAQMMQLMAQQQQQQQQQQQAQQQQQNSSSSSAASAAAQQQHLLAALMGGNAGNAAAGLMNPNLNMMFQQLSAQQQKQLFEALRKK